MAEDNEYNVSGDAEDVGDRDPPPQELPSPQPQRPGTNPVRLIDVCMSLTGTCLLLLYYAQVYS